MPEMDGPPTRQPRSRTDLDPRRAGRRGRRRRSLSSTIARIASVAIVAFVLLAAGISLQLAAGNDPALGPKKRAAPEPSSPPVQTQTPATQSQAPQTPPSTQTQSSPPPVVSRVS